MRICRFDDDRLGLVLGDEVVDVSEAINALPSVRWPFPPGDAMIANWSILAPLVEKLAATGARKPVASVHLKSPVANPTKIIGIARNRRNLGGEKTDPQVVGQTRQDGDPPHMFLKANSALVGPSDGVALRFLERRNDPEAELTIIIGKGGTDIARDQALDHIFGYAMGLDMSLRGMEPPSSRKSIDSYAVLGPWVVTRDELPNPDAVESSLAINDRQAQSANTRDFAFDVRTIVAHCSTFFTLHPGDVIMAGTPAMFERVQPGDMLTVRFDGIGEMKVAVRTH